MKDNKLEFTKREIERIEEFSGIKISLFKSEMNFDYTYDKFLMAIGLHKQKKKFTKLLKDNKYFINYEAITPTYTTKQNGYFYNRDSKTLVKGYPVAVLYITKKGIDLLFDLAKKEIERIRQ